MGYHPFLRWIFEPRTIEDHLIRYVFTCLIMSIGGVSLAFSVGDPYLKTLVGIAVVASVIAMSVRAITFLKTADFDEPQRELDRS